MKNLIIIFIGIFTLIQCSPKTSSVMQDKGEQSIVKIDPENFRTQAPSPRPAPVINLGKATTFTLDNGLEVIVVQNNKIPQVSFQISLKNDPILEGDKTGLVDMAGDLLGRGTTTKSKAEIDEAVDFIGAQFSTYSTGIYASSLTKHSDKLLEVITDVLYNPAFKAEELDKIKKQTLSGLESNKAEPNAINSNVRSRVVYGDGHPYGEIQKPEHVERISLDDTKAYYENFFIPNNAFLVIVGDITPDNAKNIANKYFSKWQRKAFKPIKHRQVELPESTQVHFADKDGAVQSVISISYAVDLKPGAPDAITASVLNSILGGSFSSRLMQNLREDKAYTYGARSSLSPDQVVANFNATANVRNEVTDSSVHEFLYELERIRNTPVSEAELQSIKSYMTGQFARSLESPQTIARFALSIAKFGLPADYYETYLQKLNSVTVQDVHQAAQKYIRPDRAHIVITGNKSEVADKLLKFDSDGKIDFYDAFGEKVAYKEIDIPTGVTPESIINDYINALGAKSQLDMLKTLAITMNGDIMGQSLTMQTYQEQPGKYAMTVGSGPMIFQSQKFNNGKAMTSQMGQKEIVTHGELFEELQSNTKVFPQLSYINDGYTLELTGIDKVGEENAYAIQLTSPSGKKTKEYYSMSNGLLIKTVQTQDGPSGPMAISIIYSDYKSVEGIMMPHSVTMEGAMPMPITLKAEKIEINKEIPADIFNIE